MFLTAFSAWNELVDSDPIIPIECARSSHNNVFAYTFLLMSTIHTTFRAALQVYATVSSKMKMLQLIPVILQLGTTVLCSNYICRSYKKSPNLFYMRTLYVNFAGSFC